MNKCKGCGAAIHWIKTAGGGKPIPCNPEKVVYWRTLLGKERIVTPNGEILSCTLEGDPETATGIGYVPHWATCPAAANFRKQGKPEKQDNGQMALF